jgi:aminoglycoside phosphotransferase family enzyme/predicted kinase
MIVVISGLPGTGKTTVAKELGRELNAPVLSTDEVRKRGSEPLKYTKRKKQGVYEHMFQMAEDLLSEKDNIILDGTFFKKELRASALQLGSDHDRCVFILEAICDEDVVKQRIEKRYQEDLDASEADFKVYKIIQSQFELIEKPHFRIHTEDENNWRLKIIETANKMRVSEKQKKLIDRLKKAKKARVIQTHISWVILDGSCAYKIKKPVRFSFVDYSTLEKRKHFCEKENQINSMLCPDLYLGTVSIRKKGKKIYIGKDGKILDYAVKMRELPQEHRMDHLIQKKGVQYDHVRKIAEILVDFHVKTAQASNKFGSIKVIKENFTPSFKAKEIMDKFFSASEKVDKIKEKVNIFLENNEDLFKRRVFEGRIRNCHGDVRTKNIFIHEGQIYLFDAIEFNLKISSCDVAAEIAFLAMDLDFYGRKDLGQVFLHKYIEATNDLEIDKIFDFYQCYRAMVEALVQSYLLADVEVGRKRKKTAAVDCEKFLNMAFRFSEKL